MEHFYKIAHAFVARVVGFATLAIVLAAALLGFDPMLATRVAAGLFSVLTVVLLIKAHGAGRVDNDHLKLWLTYPADDQPQRPYAHALAASALRDTYLWFAQLMAIVTAMAWSVTLALGYFL